MLEVQGIQLFYGESHILWDIHMSLQAGGRYSLLGRNGVGKSSFVRALMGLHPLRQGTISWKGKAMQNRKPWERVRQGLALVPQGREIFASLSVEDNLRLAMPRGKRDFPAWIFDYFPELQKLLPRRGGMLSGGQQQQLSIARALLLDPELLILDEPTEGIQPNVVQHIGEVLCDLSRTRGLTVLTIEQKVPFVRRFHEYFYVMDKGRITLQGKIDQLHDDHIQKFLMV